MPSPSPGTPEEQQAKLAKLFVSLLIDFVGYSTYLVPLAGEAGDLAWAPVSAALIFYLYGSTFISGIAFVEEILPGTDFIPTATIAWLLENTELGGNVNRVGTDRPADDGSAAPSANGRRRTGAGEDAIDVDAR